ncbi:TPA_asm: N [Celery gammacytorhabdovirus 1]|nr:TPA_asm: N [Celery gammacytorhabdovirus 1]
MARPLTQTQINLDGLQTLNAYNDLDNVTVSLRDNPPLDWSHNLRFGTVPIWGNASLDNDQIITVGAEWLAAVTAANVSQQVAVKGLRLALSLRSIMHSDQKIIFQQERPAVAGADPAHPISANTDIPLTNTFSTDLFSIRTPPAREVRDQGLDGVEGQVANIAADFRIENPANEDVQDSVNKRVVSYCFLAAYLMRLLVKDANNIVASLPSMKNRFESFYGPSRTVAGFVITSREAQTYKDVLISMGAISVTYVHALAYTHNDRFDELDERERGLLGYLALIHFAYSGIHSINLMADLQKETHAPLGLLLTLFHNDVTAPALRKMRQIYQDYERTEAAPNRSITHRYCTHFGQDYFAQLRTRNCGHLVYTIIHALKVFKVHNDISDPERIAAIQSLGVPMRNTLRLAGTIIGNTLRSRMLGGEGASAAYNLALMEQNREADDDDSEEDEEWDQEI